MEVNHNNPKYSIFKCPNCGEEIPPGSNYCVYCGTRRGNSNKRKRGRGKLGAVVLGILLAIVALVFLFLFGLNQDTEMKMADKSKGNYQFFVDEISDMCDKLDKTDPDLDTLKTIMRYSDSLLYYEDKYQSLIPNYYNKSQDLSSLVTKLRKTAAYNWAEYARSESNRDEAIGAYKNSLFLWNDESVERELNKLYN